MEGSIEIWSEVISLATGILFGVLGGIAGSKKWKRVVVAIAKALADDGKIDTEEAKTILQTYTKKRPEDLKNG